MNYWRVLVGILFVMMSTAVGHGAPINSATIDWRLWETLPVQGGDRHQPLDTLATNLLRQTSGRDSVIDSQSNRALNPTAFYLTLLFEWSGWDHARKDELLAVRDLASQYTFFHQVDRWDKTLLLRIDHPALKKMLGLPEHVKFVSPASLATTSIVDPRSQRSIPFSTWGQSLSERKDDSQLLTLVEEKGLELAHRLAMFQTMRMGSGVGVVLNTKGDDPSWLSMAALLLTRFDDANDPKGDYRQAQRLLEQVRSEFLSGDATRFNHASEQFRATVQALNVAAPIPPSQFCVNLEVAYNRWQPIRYAWGLMIVATGALLVQAATRWRTSSVCAISSFTCSTGVLLVSLVMRTIIAGRVPAATMYESVVCVAVGTAVLGGAIAMVYRQTRVLTAAAAASAAALLAADGFPAILDANIGWLEPVVRSNYWLIAHVMTITLSYAAFALASAMANIMLGYCVLRSDSSHVVRALSQFMSLTVQIGIALLACGITFGAIWADIAWGRFWGWDPKEVWALLTLLGYLGILLARFAGMLGDRGFAALNSLCFILVVMTWYGVNFILRTGLHSYGFGVGGQGVVCLLVLLQCVYVGVAVQRSRTTADWLNTDSNQQPKWFGQPRSAFLAANSSSRT